MKQLTILGSTGSIGVNTLDVVRRNKERFSIYALVAGNNVEAFAEQILEFRPRVAVLARQEGVKRLQEQLSRRGLPKSRWPELGWGTEAMVQASVASEVHVVMSSIVGVAGLEATYEAVRRGKTLGLANKEALVAAGALVMEAVRQSGAEILPVDSEHNGAHQCLRAGRRQDVRKLILTASGGPFRNTPASDLNSVTPEQALQHPTWRMGPRITIDSATLMNKGFEVIEACWLFGFRPTEVEVVVHPQSKVHAMIEYNDGSVIAQICATDMRMPIQYALTYPDRWDAPVPRLDWRQSMRWEFEAPDYEKFPLLRLAFEAMQTGGTATATLNAADEVAVEAFLKGQISFPAIAQVVADTLETVPVRRPRSIGEVLEVDLESREAARLACRRRAGQMRLAGIPASSVSSAPTPDPPAPSTPSTPPYNRAS
ncbi:MAG: 1-deoxy-D-xylulose-5-phosphate reductoisomerase [Bryobacteraceae bacterium]|nr:1-deoxy-D-xylulose-5-phosphate reductoisomerase [Bryobacteraceae bacterium]MDW8379867.1 1-deoxy-D-xylulose-5-phosphate reductoisomerase [Bryobacterales bacterium]